MNALQLLVGAVSIAFSAAAAAQEAPPQAGFGEISVESAAQACLTLAPGAPSRPVYPSDAVQRHETAQLMVALTFARGDRAPEVEFASGSNDRRFRQAVRDFVAAYRLPCLAEGAEPVQARQWFSFVLENTYWGPLRDGEAEAARLRCQIAQPSNVPSYPEQAMRRNEQGQVLLAVRFTEPDTAPNVKVLYDAGSRSLAAAAARFAGEYRLPCVEPGRPVELRQTFTFQIENASAYRLKADLSLTQLLSMVKDLQAQRVRFNFSTMGCPFQFVFVPWRPYDANRVGELGSTHPERRDFVEWLRSVVLDVKPAAVRPYILGKPVTVDVPCAVLDLM